MFFDSHAHMDHSRFDEDRAEIFADLKNHGVGYIMDVGCNLTSSLKAVALAEKYPCVYAAVGTHPNDAEEFTEATAAMYAQLVKNPKVRAIGEIGLDYYHDHSAPDVQKKAFFAQLELARDLDMPVIIHDRDAHGDVLDAISQFPTLTGVFHCFSGSAEMAKEVVKKGWYVGFTGVLTFKNARRAIEAATAIPLDRILIETDCPYLAPEPFRGQRNDSRKVPYMAKKLAEIRNISEKDAEIATTENAKRLFGIL